MITTPSFSDVVSGLGGPTGIAEVCRVSKNTAASWVRRRTFPVRVWHLLLVSPNGRALGLTSDALVRLHSGSAADLIRPVDMSCPASVDAEDAA